ncbi:MAG: LppX_LprAFG lipoprotein [Candidatus Dormibacteraeota bacterium]|nr:LppX_LprAFG lipoprotein [Candidatus Dormibacteraeota bacterium]
MQCFRLRARLPAVALGGLLLLAACSAPGTTQPDPKRVLEQAAEAMARVHSVALDAKFGAGISVQGLQLQSATSRLALPGQSDTAFKVRRGDFLLDLRVVTVGGQVFIRLPFAQFTELSPAQAAEVPDLARLLDPKTGLPGLLTSGREVRYEATEQMGGVSTDRVAAVYAPADVGHLLGGLTPSSDVKALIWVGRDDHLVRRADLTASFGQTGKPAAIEVDLHDFDRSVTITPPAVPPPSASPAT